MVVCAGPLGHGGTHTADCAFLQRLGFVSLSWALVSGNAAGRQLQTRTRLLVEASGCVRAPLLVVSGRRRDDHARRRSAQARLARAKVGRQPACWDGRVQPSCTQHSLSARACIRTALRRTAMRAKLERTRTTPVALRPDFRLPARTQPVAATARVSRSQSLAAIPRRMHRISSDLRSKAA